MRQDLRKIFYGMIVAGSLVSAGSLFAMDWFRCIRAIIPGFQFFASPTSPEMLSFSLHGLRAVNGVHSYVLGLPQNQLMFVTLDRRGSALARYDRDIASQTVAYVFVPGWYGDQPDPPEGQPRNPPYHSLARVGRQYFSMNKDGTVVENGFLETQKRLARREDHPLTFEMVYWVPKEARAELVRYFQDRALARGTIGGRITVPSYDIRARGGRDDDDIIRERCETFAMSYVQSHWMIDYPELRALVDAAGLAIPEEDGDRIGTPYLAHLAMHSRPLAIFVMGAVADPPREYHWEFFDRIRAIRRYGLNAENTRVIWRN
jgi:hypothetical protein